MFNCDLLLNLRILFSLLFYIGTGHMKTGNGREYTLHAQLGPASACECWKEYVLFIWPRFCFNILSILALVGILHAPYI